MTSAYIMLKRFMPVKVDSSGSSICMANVRRNALRQHLQEGQTLGLVARLCALRGLEQTDARIPKRKVRVDAIKARGTARLRNRWEKVFSDHGFVVIIIVIIN